VDEDKQHNPLMLSALYIYLHILESIVGFNFLFHCDDNTALLKFSLSPKYVTLKMEEIKNCY